MDDIKLEPAKHISNQPPVAAPPERLGAHDGCSQAGSEVNEPD
jgi:hypothetical protein